MNNEIIMNHIIHNGSSVDVEAFDYNRTKIFPGVYEVLRVIDGVPVFLEDHIARFKKSASLLGYELQIDDKDIDMNIRKLVEINKYYYGNVKIVINNLDKPVQDNYFFFTKSSYPTQEEIAEGIPTILFYGERNNPNAKTTDLSIRDRINAEIASKNAYEALLVNNSNEITEGSRSNIFFVKGRTISTAPAKDVLSGVTRRYIIEICRNLGYDLVEKANSVDMLKGMDGLFMTGTSPQVLPISSVDNMQFSSASNTIIKDIRESYEKLVKDYVSSHK